MFFCLLLIKKATEKLIVYEIKNCTEPLVFISLCGKMTNVKISNERRKRSNYTVKNKTEKKLQKIFVFDVSLFLVVIKTIVTCSIGL